MQQKTGIIDQWDGKRGTFIADDDGKSYPFTINEWDDDREDPGVGGRVCFILPDGRKVKRAEYENMEMPSRMTITMTSADGIVTRNVSRLAGGPWRMYSDARAWMDAAKLLHERFSSCPIVDLTGLLQRPRQIGGVRHVISDRGVVIKYCYGLSLELYLKWILTEAGRSFKTRSKDGHDLTNLVHRLPKPVADNLRSIYSDYWSDNQNEFRLMEADTQGVRQTGCNWSSFDQFVKNIDDNQFILGRYATPDQYSIHRSISQTLSREMNRYMDSKGFFEVGHLLLSHVPDLRDYGD